MESIKELYQGGSPMSPEIARKVIEAFATFKMPKPDTYDLGLTDRETELLTLMSEGLLYKEIATQMGITTGTVKQHIHKIYGKLEVNNKTEALNKFRNGV